MKKIFSVLSAVVVVMLSANMLFACGKTDVPEPNKAEPETYEVRFYSVGNYGGHIEGNTTQMIKAGDCSEKVTAVADIGWFFRGWIDDTELNFDQTVTRSDRIVCNVQESRSYGAMFSRINVQVQYVAGDNGEILGELVQSLDYGESTQSVTAIANRGYRFAGWSDGVLDCTRCERDLIENKQLTANFELITNIYKYDYKFADIQNGGESVSLTYGQLGGVKLAVPQREHVTFDGWFADKNLTKRVADEQGNILVDDDFLYEECTQFYAKWLTQNHHEYKILMVYVTEVDAVVQKKDKSGRVLVQYKMSDAERQVCEMITQRMTFELNDLAVADFVIDEYFTTVPITEDNICVIEAERDAPQAKLENGLFAYDIPEVESFLDEYDSVLVSFSFDDFHEDLFYANYLEQGESDGKYGYVHFEIAYFNIYNFYSSIEDELLDPLNKNWDANWDKLCGSYLHVLSHTVENCYDKPGGPIYVDADIAYYDNYKYSDDSPLIATKRFFLDKALFRGTRTGVPYEFWQGEYRKDWG